MGTHQALPPGAPSAQPPSAHHPLGCTRTQLSTEGVSPFRNTHFSEKTLLQWALSRS